jgi:hypothetical protein
MPENRIDSPPASVSSLVGGIISDAQQLIRQEVALAKREVQDEVTKAKTAAASLASGAAFALLGSALLCFMLVYLLYWLTSEHLPLWACFGIIGGGLAVIGLILLYAARNKASEIRVVPPRTAETMKENVQWIKSQT